MKYTDENKKPLYLYEILYRSYGIRNIIELLQVLEDLYLQRMNKISSTKSESDADDDSTINPNKTF
jgi:uncharacterized protein (DUF2225 family)